MNKGFLKFIALVSSLFLVINLTGCGVANAGINWYDFNANFNNITSGIVVENSSYQLVWNTETANITLFDKQNNISWSSIPQNAEEHTTQPQVYSTLTVSYVESNSLNSKQVHSYSDCVKKKTYSSEKIKDGIRVTYYFEKIGVSVPVEYVLRKDSVLVSIDPNQICEDTELVSKISLNPFFCSILNKSSYEGNYLFVPDGCGALIYPKVVSSGISTIITQQIYGMDEQINNYSATEEQSIRIPVYGAKNGETAVCAIIENSPETAELSYNVGSATYAYSTVYPSFYIRGAQTVETEAIMKYSATKKTLFCKGKVKEKIAVGFYPLRENEADYFGMAKCYRTYLKNEKGLTNSKNDTLLNVKYIGGVETNDFTFGVPHKSLHVATDFKEVASITQELFDECNTNINANLIGFGQNGCNISEIAGGYKYNNKFGSIKDIEKLSNNKNLSLFFNFDMLRFSDSGSGLSVYGDSSLSATGLRNQKYYTKLSFPDSYLTDDFYYFVKRENLKDIADKIGEVTNKWGINGISLDTLTSMSYSDFSSADYYAKSNFESQVTEIIKTMKSNGNKISAFGTNAYAAIYADHIYDTPISSSRYQIYDLDIPFYQLVFKGYTSMSVPSLNFATDENKVFLKAVETGIGLTYTLISSYDTELTSSEQNVFYAALYSDNKQKIIDNIIKYKSLFEKIKNVQIVDHCKISENIYCTVYDNGIQVYVNYGKEDAELPVGIVPSESYIVSEVN